MAGHGWYDFPRYVLGMLLPGALLAILLPAPLQAGATTRAAAATAETAPTPIEPPETIDALKALQEQVRAELGRLATSTRPAASAPASQPSQASVAMESATALYTAMEKLLGRIEQLIALRSQLEELKSPAKIEAFAGELAALQQRTRELEGKLADPPPYASEEELKQVQAEYDARLSDIRTRTAIAAERTKSLATAPQQIQDAAARTQKAQVDFQTAIGRLTGLRETARTPVEERGIEQEIRRAEIEAGLPAFDEQIIRLTQERDAILQSRHERRMPLIRALMVKLTDWKNMLQQIRSRGEHERIEAELDFIAHHPNAVPAYERTYWEIKLLAVSGREEISKREKTLRDRYVEFSELDPRQAITAEQASWDLLMESLDRRPSRDVREMYLDVQASIRSWRARTARIRQLLDRTVDEQRDIASQLDEFDRQLREKTTLLNRQLEAHAMHHPGDAQAEKRSQDALETQSQFTQQAQQFQLGIGRLVGRLKEASAAADSFVYRLEDYRSRLYWRYLYVPECSLWSYRWHETQAEWRSAWECDRRTEIARELRLSVEAIGTEEWTVFGLSILVAAAAGVWVRRRAVRYTRVTIARLAETREAEDEHEMAVSDRLHLFAARYAARTAHLVFPAGAALAFVPALEVGGSARALAGSSLMLLIGLALSEALIRLLFLPGKPRQRLLRCSNVVAAHYRRWGMALWTATVILAVPPLLLRALDLAPYTRGYLWALYETAALLIVLLFGFRKQMVLRVVGRPEQVRHPGILALVSGLYPLLWLGTAALLAAGIAGYTVLVAYVISAVVKTVATVLIALLATRYLTDLLIRYGQALAKQDDTEPETPASPGPGDAHRANPAADAAQSKEPATGQPPGVALQLVAAILRGAVAIGAALLTFNSWGITTVEIRAVLYYELIGPDAVTGRAAITVASVLGAILAIVVAWWVSRALRSVLNTRVYPIYTGLDRGAQAAINTMLHYFLILLGLYFALFAMRVPLGAVTVVLGTLGLGVGLGLQPLFVNFISGLMILFERHVRVGDLIVVNGELGEVTNISMRSTCIRTPDGVELVIPNSDFITKDVINWTLQEKSLRGHVKVGVAYGSDVHLVRRLLLDLARRHPLVRTYPPPEVWFTDFGENALHFEIVAWFDNSSNRWRFMTEIRYEIVRVFTEHGIEIPFPQRTLSTAGGKPLPVELVAPGKAEHREEQPAPPSLDAHARADRPGGAGAPR
ncbi:MAG: mechanosensitive ion channel domain-containing protein [Phycisphaerae bacterium]